MKLAIRELRKRAHMSQTDLADSIGVSLRTVHSWEKGDTEPLASQVWSLAEALGCTPNDVLGWQSAPAQAPSDPAERRLLADYRASTPERRERISDAARDNAALSKEGAGDPRAREAV